MDKGYDSNRVHAECESRGVHPIIPLKGERGKQIVMPIIEAAKPRAMTLSSSGATNSDSCRRAVSTCHASGSPVTVQTAI
jgi:hypothetical protein